MTAPQGCGDVNAHLQLQKKRGPTTIVLQGSGAVREIRSRSVKTIVLQGSGAANETKFRRKRKRKRMSQLPMTSVHQGSGAVREKIDEDCELLTRRTHLILPVFETM